MVTVVMDLYLYGLQVGPRIRIIAAQYSSELC